MQDSLYHPDWRQVANLADVPLYMLEAAIIRLEIFAASAQPRGSVRGFPIAAVAAHWDLPVERLERIHAALKNCGWIDKGERVAPPKISIRELVPTNGRLITRRAPTPAPRCEDVTAEFCGDPAPGRSALAARGYRRVTRARDPATSEG